MRFHLLLFVILTIHLFAGVFSATIFDRRVSGTGRKIGIKRFAPKAMISDRHRQLEADSSKRHINTFRVLNSEEKEDLERKMEEKTQKFNDDTSNERNIWRSHPQKLDWEGPDTASVTGLGF